MMILLLFLQKQNSLLHGLDNNSLLFQAKPLLYWGTVTPQSLSLSVTDSVTLHCLTLTLASTNCTVAPCASNTLNQGIGQYPTSSKHATYTSKNKQLLKIQCRNLHEVSRWSLSPPCTRTSSPSCSLSSLLSTVVRVRWPGCLLKHSKATFLR